MLKAQKIAAAVTGWIVLNCLVVGAYQIYTAYLNWNPDVFLPQEFVASLSHEERADVMGAIANYQEPPATPTPVPTRRR